MAELHRLTVRFDADTTALNAALKTSEQRVDTFTKKAVASTKEQEKAETDLARHRARILELHNQDVARRAAEAAKIQQRAQFLQTSEFVHGFQRMGNVAGGVTRTASGANTAFRRLASSLVTVAGSVVPVNSGLLRVGATLGTLGVGSAVMTGVLAGGSAIIAIWRKMGEEAREVTKAADEAGEAVHEAFLQELTQGDLPIIRQIDDIGTKLDGLAAKIREFERKPRLPTALGALLAGTPVGALIFGSAQREDTLQEEVGERLERLDEANAQKDARRTERQKKEAEERIRDAERVAKAEEAAAKRRLDALLTLASAGRASAEQLDELRAAQASFRDAANDATLAVEEQANAFKQLLRVSSALADAQLKSIRLAPIGTAGAQGGALLSAPRVITGAINPRMIEQIIRTRTEFEQLAVDTLPAIGQAFEDALVTVFTTTQGISEAVSNMVRSIIADMARLAARRFIVDPIINALRGGFDGGGGGDSGSTPTPSGPVDSGPTSALRLDSGVSVTNVFNVSTVDARGVAQFFRENAGTIQEVTARGARRSGAYRAALQGG